MRRLVEMLASLGLTVVLMALAMVLIFVGTIAQTKLGVWQAVDEYFRSWIAMVDPGLFVPIGDLSFRVPIPGGLTITGLMIVNLLAAHAIRFKATRKRVGVVVLHAGLIVLLAGEFVTGFMAHEGLMSIDEGASSSFVEDIREAELAVIDPSDPSSDRVITIPGWMLADAARSGTPIVDNRLPFGVRVDRWMSNAVLLHAHGKTDATAGIGRQARAEGKPRVAGVEGSQSDSPGAYVTLLRGGTELGTWMVSTSLIEPQRVAHGDAAFGLALRYKRTYLPFTLHLIDFRHDRFTGTNIARNFSSDIRLVDPEHGTDREVRIWMNNPLRYAGMTFYQSSYKPDGSGTVLQVVRNPGWLLPYIACILVGGGMIWHFGQTLVGFLRRRAEHGPVRADGPLKPEAKPATGLRGAWPWAIGVLGILLACSALLRPTPHTDFNLRSFSELPVSAGGRIKPLDTAARSMLMLAGGRQQVRTHKGVVPAAQYLLDLVTNPERVSGLPILRVDHPDLLSMLDRGPDDGGRIPLSVIQPHWAKIAEQAQMSSSVEPHDRDQFQRAVLELHRR